MGASDDELRFLLRRSAEERRMAAASSSDVARLAHEALAAAYQRRTGRNEPVETPTIYAPGPARLRQRPER